MVTPYPSGRLPIRDRGRNAEPQLLERRPTNWAATSKSTPQGAHLTHDAYPWVHLAGHESSERRAGGLGT